MVDSMGSRLSSEGIMYYISKLSNEGEFPIKFIPTALVNQLFEFYGRELIEIQRTVFGSNEDQWYKLPDYLLTHIREYCETCLSESKFRALTACRTKQWTQWNYLKLSTLDDGLLQGTTNTWHIVDDLEKKHESGAVWVSLSEDRDNGLSIEVVPVYFLRHCKMKCEGLTMNVQDNDVDLMLSNAARRFNQWTSQEVGLRGCSMTTAPPKHLWNVPRSYRMQPFGENSCVFTSLVNALHYIGDYVARDVLMRHLPLSLDPSNFTEYANTRCGMANRVFNDNVRGYTIKKEENIDILMMNDDVWPKLCVLRGDDGSTSHAVTVVENYIFDGSCPHAIPLNKKNLDWCCSSEQFPHVKYKNIAKCFIYEQKRPPCRLLLRDPAKSLMAINSVIHSLVQIGDNVVINQLAELSQNIQENDDILNSIIKVLSSKSKANEDWTTYGAHIVDTFHEAVECCTEDKKGNSLWYCFVVKFQPNTSWYLSVKVIYMMD